MANRTFTDKQYTVAKRRVDIFAAVTVTGTTPALQRWVYPTLGAGTNARTYVAATAAAALPSGTPYPLQYTGGAEGVTSVARTATGLWTFKFQDNYQRLVDVDFSTYVAGGLSNVIGCGINSTLTSMTANGGATVGLALLSSTGVAADPSSGQTLLFRFTFLDATEP